jgi:hypothetical protein
VLEVLKCRLDRRCPLCRGRTHTLTLPTGRRIRFRASWATPNALFALGLDWWAMLYRSENGDMVLYRLKGNPMSCYDDIGVISRQRCSAFQTCWMRAVPAGSVVDASMVPQAGRLLAGSLHRSIDGQDGAVGPHASFSTERDACA